MADFTGFYYDNIHSSTYHLIRTSEGDRYEEDLFPSFKDEEKDLVGGKGKAYFGTTLKEKKIPISVAFEDLREEDFRALRRWLRPDKFKALRLDERPYKAYWAKISKEPTFEYVCFMEEDEDSLSKVRVYKGEAKIEFVAYDPMGYCNDDTHQIILGEMVYDEDKYNWQELKTYSPFWMKDDNLIEWAPASGLLNDTSEYNTFIGILKNEETEEIEESGESGESGPTYNSHEYRAKIYNPGDLLAEYELCFRLAETPSDGMELTLSLYEDEKEEKLISSFVIYLTGLQIYDRIVIDTKKHIVKVYSAEQTWVIEEDIEEGTEKKVLKYLDLDGQVAINQSDPDSFLYLEQNRQLRYDLVKSSHWQTIPCTFEKDRPVFKIACGAVIEKIAIKYGYQYY